jgi:hypothetical protein
MAPWLQLALATALAGGAAAQGTTAALDNNYRIRTDLLPCPIGTYINLIDTFGPVKL